MTERRGGYRPNAGRKRTDIRRLLVRAPELDFSEPITAHTDVVIGFCPHCGAAWWEPHIVTYRAGQPQPEPDADGDTFPIVATEERPGQPETHYRGCPAA